MVVLRSSAAAAWVDDDDEVMVGGVADGDDIIIRRAGKRGDDCVGLIRWISRVHAIVYQESSLPLSLILIISSHRRSMIADSSSFAPVTHDRTNITRDPLTTPPNPVNRSINQSTCSKESDQSIIYPQERLVHDPSSILYPLPMIKKPPKI